MNIGYITSTYARASDTFIRNEVIELRRRGHNVHTFSIRREAADAQTSDEIRAEQASTDYILERGAAALAWAFVSTLLHSPRRTAAALALTWRTRTRGVKGSLLQLVYLIEAAYLARRLVALKIQILHNHIAENSANVAMLSSSLSGVPFSMTVHGPGIFFHPRQWALGEKIARSSFTACITEFCKSQCMLFSEIADWPKLHLVRCAVGPAFENTPPIPLPDAPRLVFVGRLCAEKGLPVLVQAICQHVEAGGACEVVLVGDGPLRGYVEAAIEKHGLHGVIRILGWKSSDEVRREIENSRALVLPSFSEGLPVVIMEALALGRPVITTQIAGIPELVSHGVNGWLVAPGSVAQLALAMKAATDAPLEALHAMSRDGMRRVAESHRLSTELSKLEHLMQIAALPRSTA